MISFSFNPNPYVNDENAYVRVIWKAFWYRTDGTTAGSVAHEQVYYEWRNFPGMTGSTTACLIRDHEV